MCPFKRIAKTTAIVGTALVLVPAVAIAMLLLSGTGGGNIQYY